MTIAESLKLDGMVRSMFGRMGEPRVADTPEHERRIREARVTVARRTAGWIELEEVALVKRGRWWVHSETDELFTAVRGVIFATASTSVVADRAAYYFCVLPDGGLAFFEKATRPATYTKYLEGQAARERRRNAPKPRPAWMEQ